ncbi:MAG: hypothetical protein N3A57_02765 [Negativicutes bacterium]|nr:hypothetical protein [Negativicutes bacterium]
MKLTGKIAIIQTTGLLLFAVAIVICGNFIWLRSYMDIEQQVADERGERLKAVIEQNVYMLGRKAVDYANWDELYYFLAGTNPRFPDQYLTTSGVDISAVDLVAVYNRSGELAALGVNGDYQPYRQEVRGGFAELFNRRLLPADAARTVCIEVDGRLWLAAAAPVTRPGNNSDSNGWVVMAEAVDRQFIERSREMARVEAAVGEVEYDALKPELRAVFRSRTDTVCYYSGDYDDINGFLVINPANGPPLVLKLVQPKVYGAVENTLKFMLVLLGAAAIFVWLINLYMRRTIFRRLRKLDEFIDGMIKGHDLSGRLEMDGNDELSTTAKLLNRLLERQEKMLKDNRRLLEDARRELAECRRWPSGPDGQDDDGLEHSAGATGSQQVKG